jgi:hypothetical protein
MEKDLGIAEHHHKAAVHVVLLVAVEEGAAGVVGGELDLGGGVGADEEDVFVEAGELGAGVDAADLKGVAMQMERVVVGALVLEEEPVALAGLEHRLVGMRVGLSVDAPELFRAVALELGVEDE